MPTVDLILIPGMSWTGVLSPYAGAFVLALLVTLLVTPLLKRLAIANGIVDWPDLNRKNHAEPVAYLGGIGIFVGWLAGLMVAMLFPPHSDYAGITNYGRVFIPMGIVLGATIITIVGLLDDVYGVSPRVKIGGQLFAAAALANGNVGLLLVEKVIWGMNLGSPPESIVYILGTLVLAVFVLGGCNAVNLIDGLDGLAAGTTAIAMLAFAGMAVVVAISTLNDGPMSATSANWDSVRIVLALAAVGALVGFLFHNFDPASVFMGDAGSLLLGYLVVTSILMFGEAGDGHWLVLGGLIIFGLPITDTALAIVRRKWRGRSISQPDSEHLHHLLRKRGLSVKQTAVVMYLIAAAFAAVGLSILVLPVVFPILGAVALSAGIAVWGIKEVRRHLREQLPEAPLPSDHAQRVTQIRARGASARSTTTDASGKR